MMDCIILVVDHEGERFFEFAGIKFDTLNACWEFNRRELRVFREGKEIGRTRVREARGDPVFCSYATNGPTRLDFSGLAAEKFESGETLVLDVPDGFDLAASLRQSAAFLSAFLGTHTVGVPVPFNESVGRVRTRMAETKEQFA